MRRRLPIALALGLLGAVGWLGLIAWARSAPRPANLGLTHGHLAPCPPTPNCVATEQAAPEQRMPPLPYTTAEAAARNRLLELVRSMPRTTILADEGPYLSAEFRTAGIGFIDDVEFRFDDTDKLIHFRSASRLGQHDLGVNRRRMAAISAAFNFHAPAP